MFEINPQTSIAHHHPQHKMAGVVFVI